jgi:hypothetical protein
MDESLAIDKEFYGYTCFFIWKLAKSMEEKKLGHSHYNNFLVNSWRS